MTIRPRDRLDGAAVALVTLLCLAWGVQQAVAKMGILAGMPPVLTAGLRSAISAALVCLWTAARGEGRALLRPEPSPWPATAIAVLFAAEFLVLFLGLARTSAARGVVFLYTAPFFVALGAHLFVPGERLGARQAAGLVLAFAGVAAAMLARGGAASGSRAGDALMLLAGALWGATTVVIKASALARAAPARVLALQLAGSAPVLLAFSLVLGESWDLARPAPVAWLSLLYQSVGVGFVSYLTWFRMVATYPAARLSAFTFLTPLFGILAGAALLGETIPATLLLALACVGVGLRLVNSPVRGKVARWTTCRS